MWNVMPICNVGMYEFELEKNEKKVKNGWYSLYCFFFQTGSLRTMNIFYMFLGLKTL